MRSLVISLPPIAGIAVLFAFFCGVCFAARGLVMRLCDEDSREELAEQAIGLLTGVSATFAFFVGFAISICWGAVTAAQNAVEQQAAAVSQTAWAINNVPDKAESAALMDRLKTFATVAADQDDDYLARGITVQLPSSAPLESLEDAVHTYIAARSESSRPTHLDTATSELVSASATVAAVANRALPRPLFILLLIVAVLVSAVMGVSTVTYGRPSMVFVYVWCLIPALSLTVVLALAFPFALRSGLPLAPLRAVAQHLSGG